MADDAASTTIDLAAQWPGLSSFISGLAKNGSSAGGASMPTVQQISQMMMASKSKGSHPTQSVTTPPMAAASGLIPGPLGATNGMMMPPHNQPTPDAVAANPATLPPIGFGTQQNGGSTALSAPSIPAIGNNSLTAGSPLYANHIQNGMMPNPSGAR